MNYFGKTQEVVMKPHVKLYVVPDKDNGGYIVVDKNGVGYLKAQPTLEVVESTVKELESQGVDVRLFLHTS